MYTLVLLAGAVASTSAFLDGFDFSQSNCSHSEFSCSNLQCVPQSKRCDGHADCSDASDENDCEMILCKPPDFFRCANSRCISSAFVCDNENDCDDFSDEKNCAEFEKSLGANTTCAEDQWQCSDHLCIPLEWRCNGQSDCLDGSDETLGCSHKIPCDGFKCKNGHCIIKEWQCDGQNDCQDNSDEIDCDDLVPPEECTWDSQRFLCKNNHTCIRLADVCDGVGQCPDGSDESPLCKSTETSCSNHRCSHTCVQLPTGAKCLCPKGYHTIDEKHCQDINECEIYGICDQKCRNSIGSYDCLCDDQYKLQKDKRSCKMESEEAIMFFSSKTEIRAYFIKAELYFPVAKNLKQVVGVDFDGRHVYWTNIFSEHESIVRSLKDGTERELLITSGLGAPEDLVIDHITKNIYFTDAERAHIGVCTNDGSHCTVLINHNVHKPRGIALNANEGEMYWTDWGREPEIGRAAMDGTKDISFVSTDIHWPNGLTIDYPNERLYWTDAKLMTLESIRLDGTDRRVVLEGVVKHPYAIAVFEDRLYWSDWATHSIQSCNKFTGKNHHTLIKEKRDFIFGISIYHPHLQQNVTNPCESSFCSDICLLSGRSTYRCACPQDKELNIDGHSCRSVEKKQRLILGANNILIHLEHQLLGKHEVTTLPVLVKKLGALAFNSIQNILYVSDLEARKIISLDLHSGLAKPLEVGEVGQISAMDHDYLGNNLYWCDSEKSTVEVMNLNTMARKTLLHDMNGETPVAIALIPEEGVMFVASQKDGLRESHLDRLLMDGSSRTHSIENGLLGPVSLTYDFTSHRIFIADASTGVIESTSAEGDDRHIFRSLQSSPIGIAALKSDIFWVNAHSRRVYWTEKLSENGFNKKITLDLDDDIDRMHITSVTPRRIGLSPCQHNNGNCSHLCLHVQHNVICACPTGMSLDSDSYNCIKRIECTADEFFCRQSNACISKKLWCDGTKNCFHGEDEEKCQEPNHCPLDSFQCNDGECINAAYHCDSHYDCNDKSDEHNCSHVEKEHCPPDHFKCLDGKCVGAQFVCNGVDDCANKEDEANCAVTTCSDTDFRCLSGACIPKSWECDHDYDCPDFSDEHADCETCSSDMFTCSNGKCLDEDFVCDNDDDCGDGSDEADCEKASNSCNFNEFSCSSNSTICLPLSARCNGTSECPHHEDEQGCSDCHIEEFTCNNKKCIPTQWLCDRSNDCGDHSDEAPDLCAHSNTSSIKPHEACLGNFQCKNGNCIDFSLVCNGVPNCFDGSDEEGFCSTSCNSINNPCAQVCQKTPSGPMCSCRSGFSLLGDGHSCEDVDECQREPPVCSQLCHNEPGAYLCDCYNGFVLKTDKKSCKAEGMPMAMVFNSNSQIRELTENSLKLIHDEKDIPRLTGLDVDVNTDFIYFAIEDSGSIHRINQKTKTREYLEHIGQPRKIAVDWVTKNVYFVNNDPKSKSIAVCNFEDKASAMLIPIDPHRQVSAIAVDASNKLLFYCIISWWMFNSPSYVIYKTNLDGSSSHELVKSTSGHITGLTVDLHKKQLFYIDQHKGELSRINYDGTLNTVIATNLTRPVGLSFFENHVYFLASAGFMGRCQLYDTIRCDTFKLNSYATELFAIAQESKQPLSVDVCKNHTCSHLCIPSKLHYQCLCVDGSVVKSTEECPTMEKEATGDDRTHLARYYHQEFKDHSSGVGPAIAGILISVGLLALFGVVYYVIKKRNTGSLNISMRFSNAGYGLHNDEIEKSILEPGQHEYSNPVDLYEAETESNNRRDHLL